MGGFDIPSNIFKQECKKKSQTFNNVWIYFKMLYKL